MNESIITYVKAFVSFMIAGAFTLLGGQDNLAMLLVTIVAADVILGICKGFKNDMFSSSILVWGIVNKTVYFMIIFIMVQVDNALGMDILRNTFVIWFCICDGASIAENSISLGLPVPDEVKKVLVQVQKGFSINISKIVIRIIEDYGVEIEEKEKKENE